MRVEPYSVGSVLHVTKRGARGMEIVRDNTDRWRFVRNLFIFNDHYQPASRTSIRMYRSDLYSRPEEWPERKPLVAILGWTLMDNHFHLLLKEITVGGVSKFMQRFCGSMSMMFNGRHEGRGSIFQGAFKSKTIDTDEYLQYAHAYIVVKNTFENYPGGLKKATKEFDRAWQWAEKHYPFTSFLTPAKGLASPIIDIEVFNDLGLNRRDFKRYAQNVLVAHGQTRDDFTNLHLEAW
jgi:REP element-mobilizing transposase RayT